MIKNWIDIVRENDYFDLIEENVIPDNKVEIVNGMGGTDSVRLGSNIAITDYDILYRVTEVPGDFPGVPPTFIAITNFFKNYDEEGNPHGNSPAPAQRYENICFMWASVSEMHVIQCDNQMDVITTELKECGNTLLPDQITLHREDGFPATIEMIALSKYLSHGVPHRKGGHAAIRASYIIANWYVNGRSERNNGPYAISIEDYQEFWVEGKYKGYREKENYLNWKVRGCYFEGDLCCNVAVTHHRPRRKDITGEQSKRAFTEFCEFLETLSGKTDRFSNTFFLDAQDEVCFLASF